MLIVIGGVCGVGKSTICTKLVQMFTCSIFIEGDDFHPACNREKMSLGIPLTDQDRIPWLHSLKTHIATILNSYDYIFLSCSALKKSFRDMLREIPTQIQFYMITGTLQELEERLKKRENHFMKVNMIQSQLDALELPTEYHIESNVQVLKIQENLIKKIHESISTHLQTTI